MFKIKYDKPWVYPIDYPYPEGPFSYLELVAAETILIPALMMGRIPHGIKVEVPQLKKDSGCVLTYRLPGVFIAKGLLIDSGPIKFNEDLFTEAFNMTNLSIKIPKGIKVSCLLSLDLK